MAWIESRDRRTVTTAANAVIKGRLSAADTRIDGNLTVNGKIIGNIDISNITGLLGNGFSLQFPDIANNITKIEIEGVNVNDPVVVVTGPGYEIERVAGFHPNGKPFDQPGFSKVHPLIFESQGADADILKNYFDQYRVNPGIGRKSISLLIFSHNRNEFMRWNFFEFYPESYAPSIDGRIRFILKPYSDNTFKAKIEAVGLPKPQQGVITNPKNLVEIEGVTSMYPIVELDDVKRTLKLTYRFDEELPRGDVIKWVGAAMKDGASYLKALSVIQLTNGNEVSRKNYFECFPIKYEMFSGFALSEKLQSRVTLSYNFWENA